MKTDNSKSGKNGTVKNGLHKEYFKDGSVSCEGKFAKGEKEGEWKYYLLNGKLKAIGKFKHNKMIGEWKWYRENGKLMQTGFMDNDIKTGLWTRYKENGTLLDVTEFSEGKKVSAKKTVSKKVSAPLKKNLKTCKNGHNFYKSSDCPTCPICEKERKPKDGFLSSLSAPARRALENNGIKTLKQLSEFNEKEILKFHGMGKASLPTLIKELQSAGLTFKKK